MVEASIVPVIKSSEINSLFLLQRVFVLVKLKDGIMNGR